MIISILINYVILLLLSPSLCLEYEKSANLKFRPHENITHLINLKSLNQIPVLFKKPKNLLLFFTSTWCVSCADLHSSLSKASSYEFVNNSTNIVVINCLHEKEICSKYNITSFPHIKVYLYTPPSFAETIHVPFSYNLDDILEYLEKISHGIKSRPLIKLSSMKAVTKYSKTNGDVSFLLILDDQREDEETELANEHLLDCYRSLALSHEYLPRYYFAYIYSSKYHNNYDMKIPSIVLTGVNYRDFNLNHVINKCEDMEEFVKENQYPLFIKANKNYLNKMHKLQKTVIIMTLHRGLISHVNHIMTIVQNIARNRRDLIFSYIDTEEDKDLIKFFNIKKFVNDSLIVYDFKLGKYYLDNYRDEMRIHEIIKMIDNDEIEWKSGYFIEDFLYGMGITIDRKIIIFTVFVILSIIVILVAICICNFINFLDKKSKKD